MALSAKELQSFSSRITKSISPSTASNPRVTQLREQTNQVLSQGPQMVQQPKTVVNAPIKVAQPNIVQSNASWIGGQVNQNVLQPIANTVKKIGNFTAKLVNPQSTMLKDAGIDTAKVETLILKPNQKKLAPEQLQKVAGAQAVMKTRDKEEVNRVALDTKNKIKAIQEQFRTKTTEEVRRELPKDYKKPNMIKSVAETLALSFVSLGQNIGGSLEQLGNAAGGSTGGGLGAKFLLTNAGKKLAQESENIIASNPEWVKESNVENWGVEKVAKLATAAAPSILVNIGANILGGPAGSYLSAYLLEAGGTYREAKKAGKSENEAQLYATTVGVVNSYLEKKFPDELFKGQKIVMKKQLSVLSKQYAREMVRVAKEYTKRFVGGGTLEAGMEVMQEIVANTVAQAYDKTRKIHDNLLESAVGAFFSAGPIAVAGTGNVKTIINEGEHTPQAVIGQVIANGQENTVEGKELLKTAVEAQQKGQNVLIETTKEGKVDSEVTTVNQEETKVETKTEKPKVEYTAGAIKKIQTQMDEILGVDPNMKNFKMKQKLWGESFMITDQAANAGDKDAIADIEKLVALQIQLEDMRDARQAYLKNKKTKKSAKDYVEGKVKERSVKFRETKEVKQIRKLQGDELLLAIENNIDKVADISKNKLQAVDDFVELEDISKKLLKGKEKPADITTAYEILQRNGIDIGQQAGQTANEYVAQKGPKFREDTSKPLTLEEIKAQNAAAKQESAKTGQENAEDTAEKVMGWKTGDQKREFDAAMNKKDAAKVREMLPNVPEYFKTEFKQEIDEVLNNDFTEEAKILRGTKGLTADDIMKTYPNIQLKKDVPATDIYGNKKIIPEGEKLTPYELKGNKVLLQDGETYIVTKNQFQNIKGQSKMAEGKPFAPELEGLEETVKGGKPNWVGDELIYDGETLGNIVENKDKTWSYQSDLSEGSDTFTTREEAMSALVEEITDPYAESGTKYSQYTLPGGENYREVLIKAPTAKDAKISYNLEQYDKFPAEVTKVFEKAGDDNEMVIKGLEKLGYEVDYDRATFEVFGFFKSTPEAPIFKSSHWDDPNVIAHLRMNDREYNGEKVTFMEELQSDWAREGRSKGFIDDSGIEQAKKDLQAFSKQLQEKYNQGEEGLLLKTTREERAKWIELNDATRPSNGVPNNPLLKNWQELTIKRALKDAINSDAEYFAWINGEQTSNRYNLSTQVESVKWFDPSTAKTGKKSIVLEPKSGSKRLEFEVDKNGAINQIEDGVPYDWKGKKLDEVLGKGLADKIMADEKGTLSGEGLKFGGEWANTLYDKQVKNIVEDLTGGKVEEIDMGLSADEKVKRFLYNGNQGTDIMAGDRVTANTIKVGQEIYEAGKNTNHIIIEVIGDGKFKAIGTSELFDMSGDERAQYISDLKNPGQYEKRLLQKNGEDSRDWINKQLENRKRFLDENSEIFDLSVKKATQQAIKLTPEIKARIKGEALQIETSGKMFEEAKFRVKDDVKRMTGKTITDTQEQELIDLNKKIFGDDKVNITLQIMANSKALGKYEQNMIDILDGQADPKATYLHEAVHKYLDVFSTSDEYTQVLEEGAVKYKIEDFAEVEERIAEDFIAYAKNKDAAPKTISGKIRSFFDSMLERIKIYFGNKSAIDRLYSDIVEGKAAKKATKTAQETTPGQKTDVPTNEQAQTPVGEGDKTKSKAYTRVYDRLAEEAQQDVSYNKLNLEKDTQNALEFITTDPKAAIRVGLGLEEAPAGQTETAISIALADKAGRDGDFALQSQLESSRSLRQTRRGQEIVSERGRFNEDSPHFFIRELMDMRLKNLGTNLMSSIDEMSGKVKSVKKAAIEQIDKGVSKLKNKIKADRKKITLAQDIIDSIIC